MGWSLSTNEGTHPLSPSSDFKVHFLSTITLLSSSPSAACELPAGRSFRHFQGFCEVKTPKTSLVLSHVDVCYDGAKATNCALEHQPSQWCPRFLAHSGGQGEGRKTVALKNVLDAAETIVIKS